MVEGVTIFDFEVTSDDWLVVAKEVDTGTYHCFHNDAEGLAGWMETDPWLCGFNVKHYDNHILKAILCGFTPQEVKKVNDDIIVRGINGWEIPELREKKVFFDTIDLMDDVQMGTSLKSFEAHIGMNIKETDIPFDIGRPLTMEEVGIMYDYCRADVNATELLFKVRMPYLENKVNLGRKCGMSDRQSLKMTNAKLTAAYLGAEKVNEWTDERAYRFPENLLTEYVPEDVLRFFEDIHDMSIPDEEYFDRKMDTTVGTCPVTIGFGGIHGAIPNYVEETTEGRSIRNKDVASYYPNLVRHMGYASRNIPNPEKYGATIDERVAAKKAKDTKTANALKLVLNTFYGAMGNRYNELHDPLMMRSVCITGQLFLLELSCHLLKECQTLRIIQLNTDGIMVSFDNSDEEKWQEITKEWEQRTGFELEEDRIRKIVQKDVNNYVEVPEKGSPKVKGGKLVRGILTNDRVDFTQWGFPDWENLSGGAFKINNDAVIIPRAVISFFVKGIPVEDTINASQQLLDFQIIAKASSKYSGAFQIVDGEKVPVQKVNRVYACKDIRYGTLYKTHSETGSDAKIGGLPEHCYIDNDNHKGIWCVDKEWYIKQAKETVNMFLGIKPPKPDKRRINSLKRKAIKLLEEL